MMMTRQWKVSVVVCLCYLIIGGTIYIDHGNPYKDQPLKVGELTMTVTGQGSPMHTKDGRVLINVLAKDNQVCYKRCFDSDLAVRNTEKSISKDRCSCFEEPGDYAAVVFIGGLNTLVMAELYETVLLRIASHGFFVFGLDYSFPVASTDMRYEEHRSVKQEISKYFEQYTWLQAYMTNKTEATVVWNMTSLVCHSSGCDIALKMIKQKPREFITAVFLEPFSFDVKDKINIVMPAFMYGTELSEQGVLKCALPGYDYNTFYDIWKCPKVVWNVAEFGHCDFLDPAPWTVCRDTHFCKITTNTTQVPAYREFVQGAVSSFLVTFVQGRVDTFNLFTNKTFIPFELLELKTDLNCIVN